MRGFTVLIALPLALAGSKSLFTRQSQDNCVTCIPSPPENQCDITTSCTAIGSQTFCACRAGFRADGVDPADSGDQWRLPAPYQEGRVFVAPGIPCNTLCDNPNLGPGSCAEVTLREDCS